MATLEVIQPGMLTLIQDVGRLGVGGQGLSQGGAMDLHAYCWSNYLVGNEMDCPQLEITLGQAQFEAHGDMVCAIAGADMAATLDGMPIAPWQSFLVKDGQVIKFHHSREGLRAYLAVKGGFNVPKVLGSSSTVVRNGVGGVKPGMPLQKGDCLVVRNGVDLLPEKCFKSLITPARFIPDYRQQLQLRVIESYQCDHFLKASKQHFYQGVYKVTQQTDRMGCRFEGPKVLGGSNGIISEGIAYGAIQIPPNGQPIVLLNDRQTLGGYPKLGCIARIDMSRLAQARPGQEVQFIKGNMDDLLQQWLIFSRFFALPF
ncbi:biotin-dependent carboxyltransferase family protein [uncultured Photobacterium sp.]|uniref:5-oxoprolinase subunit C family protein n=1 Tax=uncultured Photobacterium sp. TaxID=173973 RepID=UPI002623D827|nr:biotin-dependent carboxyltransferase family protein [uncultured Photobacterium sp.]